MLREAELFEGVVELRHVDNLISHMLIVDDAEAMLGPVTRRIAKRHVDLWTNNSTYVDAIKWVFNRVWQDSVDIKSRIEYLQTGKPIERTEVIKGRDAIYKIAYAINSRAKTDKLLIIESPWVEIAVRDFTSINIELKKRGVRVRCLTSVTDQNLEFVEEMSKQFEVRHTDNVPFRSLLTETEAMFAWVPIKETPGMAIYSNDADFVRILWDISENAWENAIDAQSRIEEIRRGKPLGRVSKPLIEYLSKRSRKQKCERT